MKYTAVIRTLGKGGEKYLALLNSLVRQTIRPTDILVYIAENFTLPKETVGKEKYIYVQKGMVAQRALQYNEIKTEYCLFLDDDVYLPDDGVEKLFYYLTKYNADVIAPDVFPNSERPFVSKLAMAVSGRMWPRCGDKTFGYKVMRNASYSYNNDPEPGAYWSQTNAGPCFLCSKENFLKIHFEEEKWMDNLKYAQGDDQVMFYKMYLCGLKQLTLFYSGIKHLDAGSTLQNENRTQQVVYSDLRFKVIFFHRFIYLPEKSACMRIWDIICIGYALFFSLSISLLKTNCSLFKLKWKAIRDGIAFLRSNTYRNLPIIKKAI